MRRMIVLALFGVIGGVASLAIYSCKQKEKIDIKSYAAEFPKKKWYYSTDGGKTWTGGAEVDLKAFQENGEPIHVKPEWVWGEWKDENTIMWTASDSSTSIWKSFDIKLSESELAKTKTYAASFSSKKWYYSVDGGKNWTAGAKEGLKGFDQNGIPIHVSAAWISGRWEDENTIFWIAINGDESIWKAFDHPPL